MVVVSYSGKEINAKLVYYGAGLSGKTTNLESIYEAVPDQSRGKMVSMKTQSDRTLFFDLLPLDLGEIMGFKTRFLLYTVPGQVFYNATRKLVLKGADAIVFVADSEVGKMEENKESLANLRANLAEYNLSLDEIPWVIQYNKRDLPNVYSLEELNKELNPGGRVPFFEAVATKGKGVFETFRGVSHLLMEKVTKDLRRTPGSPSRSETAAPPAPARPAAAAPAPLPPGTAIVREAQETSAREAATSLPLDYGREIALPSPSGSRAATPAAPSPIEPSREAELEPVSSWTPPAAPVAPAPVAEVFRPSAPVVEAPSRPSRTPEANGEPANVSVVSVQAEPGEDGVTIPIRVARGETREVTLRIVLRIEG